MSAATARPEKGRPVRLTAAQRGLLKHLDGLFWFNPNDRSDAAIIGHLRRKGFVGLLSDAQLYRITPAGRAALALESPPA